MTGNYGGASKRRSDGRAISASGTELASVAYIGTSNDLYDAKNGMIEVKGGRTGESPRPCRTCTYGKPKLEGDDPGKQDKIAGATDKTGRPNSSCLKVG